MICRRVWRWKTSGKQYQREVMRLGLGAREDGEKRQVQAIFRRLDIEKNLDLGFWFVRSCLSLFGFQVPASMPSTE